MDQDDLSVSRNEGGYLREAYHPIRRVPDEGIAEEVVDREPAHRVHGEHSAEQCGHRRICLLWDLECALMNTVCNLE